MVKKDKNVVKDSNIIAQGNVHIGDKNIKVVLGERKEIPHQLTPVPQIDLADVIGRKGDLEEIDNNLNRSSKLLLVNGLGGIGKTTVAKAYLQERKENFGHIAWINSSPSLKSAIVQNIALINNLYLKFGEKDSEDIRFELILNALRNLKGHNFLVLDNVSDEVEKLMDRLPSKPNWKVLLTSRQRLYGFEEYELGLLSHEDAKNLFCKHYKGEVNDEELEELKELVGYHTLTIELLAKTLEKNFTLERIKDLTNYLIDQKLDDEVLQVFVRIAHSEEEVNIYSHLMKAFKLADLEQYEKWLLTQLSILPSIDINGSDLLHYLKIKKKDKNRFINSLNSLVQKGWLGGENRNRFRLHQIIQEICSYKLRPTPKKCRLLIESLIEKLYPHPFDIPQSKENLIVFGKSILNNFKDYHDKALAILSNHLSMIYFELGKFQEALEFQERSIKIKRNLKELDESSLATSYSHLGLIYGGLGKVEKSLNFEKKAFNIREKQLKENHPNLNQRLNENDSENLEFFIPHLDLKIAHNPSSLDHQIKALSLSYHNLSSIYKDLGKLASRGDISLLEKALKLESQSLKLIRIREDTDYLALAQSYHGLALIYLELVPLKKYEYHLGRAEKFQLDAIKIREQLLDKNHPHLAMSYNNLTGILSFLGRMDQALKYQKKAIEIQKQILDDYHPDLAQSYINLCWCYYLKKNYDLAYKYAVQAVSILTQIFSDDHPMLELATGWVETVKPYLSKT